MKKLLLILLCLPMIGFGQNVYIPDANFKAILVGNSSINTNGDTEIQVSEATAFSSDISCSGMNISDLTGIEAFTALTQLNCRVNQLTSLDVSQNTALTYLYCDENQLTILDLSQNTALIELDCNDNQLISLDVRNGNNTNFSSFNALNNPNLTCINVDNATWSTNNWTDIDTQHYFSNNCSGTAIEEHSTNKELLKVTDLLGRETKLTNQPLFYIYDDGTVEKRIVIE
jgi:hypothetical protein